MSAHSMGAIAACLRSAARSLPEYLPSVAESHFFIDNLLVRIHFIIVITRWTGLAPWDSIPTE